MKSKTSTVPRSEDELQILCIAWFDREHGINSSKSNKQLLIYHIPNQGQRRFTYTIKLCRMGMRIGIPDVHLPLAKNGYSGLFIEFKFGKGKRTRQQICAAELLSAMGNLVVECRSLEEFKAIINNYLK